jgi:beta-glucosidase
MFKLKDDFVLGVATASMQIEGGEVNSNWNDWYSKGNISDGSNPAISTQHYELWESDAQLLNSLGIKDYRMSLEWSRIQPNESTFDENVIEHYVKEITFLKELGIKCLVTLHHFSNPMWFENKGGFTILANNKFFLAFVEKVVERFGTLVDEYITINEPNVYAVMGYMIGVFPPGLKSIKTAKKVMQNLASAHIDAYNLIHTINKDAKVSFAHHLIAFVPKKKNIKDKICTSIFEKLFQTDLTNAMFLGKFSSFIKNVGKHKKGQYIDFIGLNYYTRSAVSGLSRGTIENSFISDLGWEIYPKGLIECAEKLYRVLKLPIYITENGVCDKSDAFRSKYIYEHLREITKSDLPIQRYYHWCFIDNFEWAEGMSAKFGIVEVDINTQKRTVKRSGYFYSDVIKAKEINEEIYNKYIRDEEYHK